MNKYKLEPCFKSQVGHRGKSRTSQMIINLSSGLINEIQPKFLYRYTTGLILTILGVCFLVFSLMHFFFVSKMLFCFWGFVDLKPADNLRFLLCKGSKIKYIQSCYMKLGIFHSLATKGYKLDASTTSISLLLRSMIAPVFWGFLGLKQINWSWASQKCDIPYMKGLK